MPRPINLDISSGLAKTPVLEGLEDQKVEKFRTEQDERRASAQPAAGAVRPMATPSDIKNVDPTIVEELTPRKYEPGRLYVSTDRRDYLKVFRTDGANVIIHVVHDKGVYKIRRAVPDFDEFETNAPVMFPSITEQVDESTNLEVRDLANKAAKSLSNIKV